MTIVLPLIYILIFPGFLFLALVALLAEYVDRKLCAKLQNRVGPPWYQPFADLIKLAAKQDLVPELADTWMFRLTPLVALTAVLAAFLYIPIWSNRALFGFQGDLIVVLYLLTIPTVTFFLGGWYSRSVFSMIGAARSLMQLFAYEIPLFLCILAPAILANTWSIGGTPAIPATPTTPAVPAVPGITEFYAAHPAYALINLLGLGVSMIALLGKLERVPFDIPEAETEIVAGSFTEFSGRRLAIFRLAISIEMIVAASLFAAVFIPFGLTLGPVPAFLLYLVKVFAIVAALSVLRTIFARLRIDQMINFCWQIAAPLAFLQVLADLILKGVLPA